MIRCKILSETHPVIPLGLLRIRDKVPQSSEAARLVRNGRRHRLLGQHDPRHWTRKRLDDISFFDDRKLFVFLVYFTFSLTRVFTYSFDSAIHLVPDVDSMRIISNASHELLQKVPAVVCDIFRIGSMAPGAILLEASKEFQVRFSYRFSHSVRMQPAIGLRPSERPRRLGCSIWWVCWQAEAMMRFGSKRFFNIAEEESQSRRIHLPDTRAKR